MTAVVIPLTGAASSKAIWDSINWDAIEAEVYRLQMRIAKAVREGRHGKVKALQWLLTHSFHAKLLAVRRVVQNHGGKTPGVDNVVWKTPQEKLKAAQSLKRKGYQTKPLRRIYIPKKDGRNPKERTHLRLIGADPPYGCGNREKQIDSIEQAQYQQSIGRAIAAVQRQ